MASAPLYALTASETAAQIAAGRLTPVDVVDALLDRIARLEPTLHAWAYLDADGARREARRMTDAAVRGPLHGVPIGVKDIFNVRGMPVRAGSRTYDVTPDEDATTVARLRAAGALILGKTHTTEFAYADPSPACNPWHPAHTPGGSSSGSAAAVAAGMIPAALGTQTAGSVLRPAAFCGIVGFKPTYGRLSRYGILPFAWTLDHAGVLARSVADAALLLRVMEGPDGRDGTCRIAPTLPAPADAHPPRLGLLDRVYPERLSAEGSNILLDAAERFRAAGATVQPVSLPAEFGAALDVHHVIMVTEGAAVHVERLAGHEAAFGPRLRLMTETGALVPASLYLRAQQARAAIRAVVLPLFEGVDALLAPPAAGAAPAGLDSTGDPSFNAPWSLLGLPAMTLPAGRDRDGLPLGVQLVAAPWADARLLAAAAWCERVLGPATVAESRP